MRGQGSTSWSGSGTAVSALRHEGRLVGRRDLHAGRFHAPDLVGVLGDGSVAGELPTRSDIADHHLGPLFGVLSGKKGRR